MEEEGGDRCLPEQQRMNTGKNTDDVQRGGKHKNLPLYFDFATVPHLPLHASSGSRPNQLTIYIDMICDDS